MTCALAANPGGTLPPPLSINILMAALFVNTSRPMHHSFSSNDIAHRYAIQSVWTLLCCESVAPGPAEHLRDPSNRLGHQEAFRLISHLKTGEEVDVRRDVSTAASHGVVGALQPCICILVAVSSDPIAGGRCVSSCSVDAEPPPPS